MQSLDLALMVFKHTEGAERAYATACSEVPGAPWTQEVAFAEHHRHDRLIVRGTVAGHYLDADDEESFIGARTVEGAVGGAAAGALLGPPGFAAGLVGGGLAGSISEERSGPHIRGALFDEIRRLVPLNGSAVVMLAAPEHVDAMISALAGTSGALVRHRLDPDAARALRDAVADSPAAAPGPA